MHVRDFSPSGKGVDAGVRGGTAANGIAGDPVHGVAGALAGWRGIATTTGRDSGDRQYDTDQDVEDHDPGGVDCGAAR